jgi:hypothetical protein
MNCFNIFIFNFISENAYVSDRLLTIKLQEHQKRELFTKKAFDIIVRMLSFASEKDDDIDIFLKHSHYLSKAVYKIHTGGESDLDSQGKFFSEETKLYAKKLTEEAVKELKIYGRAFVSAEDAKKIATSLLQYKGGKSGGRKKSFQFISQDILRERNDLVTVVTDITLKKGKAKQRKPSPTKFFKKDYDSVDYFRFPEQTASCVKKQLNLPSSSKQATVRKQQRETPSVLQERSILSSAMPPEPTSVVITDINQQKKVSSPKLAAVSNQEPVQSLAIPRSRIPSMKKVTTFIDELKNIDPDDSNLDPDVDSLKFSSDLLGFGNYMSPYLQNLSELNKNILFQNLIVCGVHSFGQCVQCIKKKYKQTKRHSNKMSP